MYYGINMYWCIKVLMYFSHVMYNERNALQFHLNCNAMQCFAG